MDEPILVDLTYRGMRLLTTARMRDIAQKDGAWRAFLDADGPLPVGTPVIVQTDSGARLDALVAHVVEAEGASGGGMTLAFEAAAEPALRSLAGLAGPGSAVAAMLSEVEPPVSVAALAGSAVVGAAGAPVVAIEDRVTAPQALQGSVAEVPEAIEDAPSAAIEAADSADGESADAASGEKGGKKKGGRRKKSPAGSK